MEELIVQKKGDIIQFITLENNKIVEYNEISDEKKSCIGNIYYGKIKSVLPKINTLFVDIGLKKPGYLELKSFDKKYKAGDEIIVKVKKDETSKKGAKLTTNLSQNDQFSFVPLDHSPILLFDANSVENRVVNEFMTDSISGIFTNIEDLYFYIKPLYQTKTIYFDDTDFIDKFGLLTELENISKKKIWLKFGGNIVIDKTEALIAIDVNSAKGMKKGADRDLLALNTNLEAAIEIARQIRLKDLKGMILVDFINLKSSEDMEKIVEILKEESIKDRKRLKVYGFTKLGLCEMTRSVGVPPTQKS